MSKLRCPNCGYQWHESEGNFCANCGRGLHIHDAFWAYPIAPKDGFIILPFCEVKGCKNIAHHYDAWIRQHRCEEHMQLTDEEMKRVVQSCR